MQESTQGMISKDLRLLYNPQQFQEHDPRCEECTAKTNKKKHKNKVNKKETDIDNPQSDPKTPTTSKLES